MKRVLLVSYFFPPDGGAGTQRVAKLCKYIKDFKWEAFVLTRQVNENRGIFDPEDKTLETEIDSIDVDVTRIGRYQSNQIGFRTWPYDICKIIPNIVTKHRIDLIFITMSPYTLANIAPELRLSTSIPVVLDIRDPWLFDGWNVYKSKKQWSRDYAKMESILRTVDGLIVNTPEVKKKFLSEVPSLDAERVTTITNGYDDDDFNAIEQNPKTIDSGIFNIVHTGFLQTEAALKYKGIYGCIRKILRFYPEKIDYGGRTDYYLLKALKRHLRREPNSRGFRFTYVGKISSASRRMVRKLGLQNYVNFVGYVSHEESIEWLNRADALFLPLHGVKPGKRSLVIPGKTYEYLAAGKPILACLPEGDAKDIVVESGKAVVARPTCIKDIEKALKEITSIEPDYRDKGHIVESRITRYRRKELAKEFADFFSLISSKDMLEGMEHTL